MKKVIKRLLFFSLILTASVLLFILIINLYVKESAKEYIIFAEKTNEFEDVDAVIVLGCKVFDDTPSLMLSDRLDKGIELYGMGVGNKLLMSGDHSQKEYDEVNAMKKYAIGKGIVSSDIFMDHAGFSTYESLFRAKEIFGAKKIIIVTQEYHLYRAVYIARKLGIDAFGVPSDYHEYKGQAFREGREALARVKDFFTALVKPNPTYLGEKISLNQSGDITNG